MPNITSNQTIRVRTGSLLSPSSFWQPLKVVHLVRDPRGVIASRLGYPRLRAGGRAFNKSREGIRDAAGVLCSQFLEDMRYFSKNKSSGEYMAIFQTSRPIPLWFLILNLFWPNYCRGCYHDKVRGSGSNTSHHGIQSIQIPGQASTFVG